MVKIDTKTSTVIAKESYPNSKLGVGTGEKFPDALIAELCWKKKAPVLLVKKDILRK